MKKTVLFGFVLIVVLSLVGCGKYKENKIEIVVPAGTTKDFLYIEDFIYSDEEISTNHDTLTLTIDKSGDESVNAEIVLKPIEYEEENAYERIAVTSGTPLEIDVEEDAWFKVGVALQNPTDKDVVVNISIDDVIVRVG